MERRGRERVYLIHSTDPKLSVGDWIAIDGTTLRVVWVTRVVKAGDKSMYSMRQDLMVKEMSSYAWDGGIA